MTSPEVLCLLPVRNGAADLADWFAGAARFCDAVVALDDGSSDETLELLEAEPLVRLVLTNPRRDGYAGWDDGANRSRLLDAAQRLDPDWIIWVDADERIDPEDAAALRQFLRTDALPGVGYGLQHFRMWGEATCDPRASWVYRLFAYEKGQRLATRRLHFNPIPLCIPRRRWLRTTVRLRHLGAASEGRRRARLAKYREADPNGEYGRDFGGLSAAPVRAVVEWRPRPPGLPMLIASHPPAEGAT